MNFHNESVGFLEKKYFKLFQSNTTYVSSLRMNFFDQLDTIALFVSIFSDIGLSASSALEIGYNDSPWNRQFKLNLLNEP